MQHWMPPTASLVPSGGNACDFCNTCPAITFYPCNNFLLNGQPVFRNGNGAWAACHKCSEFIDTGRWSSLAERSFQKFMKHHAVPRHSATSVRIQFADVVRLFAANRKKCDY
jgi:Zn-finger protein